jgi:hypothetical protein
VKCECKFWLAYWGIHCDAKVGPQKSCLAPVNVIHYEQFYLNKFYTSSVIDLYIAMEGHINLILLTACLYVVRLLTDSVSAICRFV